MHICISHRTALSYLLRMPNLRREGARPSRASSIPEGVPGDAEARALFEALQPNLSDTVERLHVLVSTQSGRRRTKTVCGHLCSAALPPGSFIPADAMGIEFHVCAPELVFLQMAEELEMRHLIYVGFALCSSFRLDDWEDGGCVKRGGFDRPLTSVERIRAFLERLPASTRNRAIALRAIEHVRDGARSPREGGLAMAIGLPISLGGRSLGETAMNQEIRVYDGIDARGNARWVTRIPDILVTAHDRNGRRRRVGVDYDAKATHDFPERAVQRITSHTSRLERGTSQTTSHSAGRWTESVARWGRGRSRESRGTRIPRATVTSWRRRMPVSLISGTCCSARFGSSYRSDWATGRLSGRINRVPVSLWGRFVRLNRVGSRIARCGGTPTGHCLRVEGCLEVQLV